MIARITVFTDRRRYDQAFWEPRTTTRLRSPPRNACRLHGTTTGEQPNYKDREKNEEQEFSYAGGGSRYPTAATIATIKKTQA